ncbi:MAG: DUF2339 domain-containing protein [Pseudomonadales bacterium]
MPILIAIIATALGSALGSLEIGLLFGLVAGMFALQRRSDGEIARLERKIQKLQQTAVEPTEQHSTDPESVAGEAAITSTATTSEPVTAIEQKTPHRASTTMRQRPAVQLPPAQPGPLDHFIAKAKAVVWSYFTDGNIFVRIGLLVLFFGVAFLLRYAAEHSLVPLELRFITAALVGLGLLGAGWRLRQKNRAYALLLQGGGIGIVYITIFAAFQISNLLPSLLTFLLLVTFALLTAALAVFQNARGLAIFASVGGFLAPFLASSGSGNYIGLFSYFALLNASIFIIAWKKSWRLLNLIGFVFTFLTFTAWFAFEYQAEMLLPTVGFLLLFFLMYSLIGVFYALKQDHKLRGLIDGTLVFGTPVIASSLMMAMFRQYEYGIALTAAALGVYYVLISRFLWRRAGEPLRLLAEAMLAIGVVFATLAIPYALDGHWTSATWALEAAGILWVSIRQQRNYAKWFAIVVQFAAGLFFAVTSADNMGSSAWFNPAFMGAVFIAIGAMFTSKILYDLPKDDRSRLLHGVFFVWALAWWLFGFGTQIEHYLDGSRNAWLVVCALTAGAMVYSNKRFEWHWNSCLLVGAALLPVLFSIAANSVESGNAILAWPALLFWGVALWTNYWVIVQVETSPWKEGFKYALHTGFSLLVALIVGSDLHHLVEYALPTAGSAYTALIVLPVIVIAWLSLQRSLPAIKRLGDNLQLSMLMSACFVLGLWSLAVATGNSADASPLPYLPFLNPIDLACAAALIMMIKTLPSIDRQWPGASNMAMIAIGAVGFVWLSAVLMRSIHHYMEVPYQLSALMDSAKVQTALSILWTAIGMAGMLLASKRSLRPLWIAAAALIGIVLAKMFFIDLDAAGTIERIISFMVVGGMLVALGYFSPIPDRSDQPSDEELAA